MIQNSKSWPKLITYLESKNFYSWLPAKIGYKVMGNVYFSMRSSTFISNDRQYCYTTGFASCRKTATLITMHFENKTLEFFHYATLGWPSKKKELPYEVSKISKVMSWSSSMPGYRELICNAGRPEHFLLKYLRLRGI